MFEEIFVFVEDTEDHVFEVGLRLLVFFELLTGVFGGLFLLFLLLEKHLLEEGDLMEFRWYVDIAVNKQRSAAVMA